MAGVGRGRGDARHVRPAALGRRKKSRRSNLAGNAEGVIRGAPNGSAAGSPEETDTGRNRVTSATWSGQRRPTGFRHRRQGLALLKPALEVVDDELSHRMARGHRGRADMREQNGVGQREEFRRYVRLVITDV